jgi:hypothetical protein
MDRQRSAGHGLRAEHVVAQVLSRRSSALMISPKIMIHSPSGVCAKYSRAGVASAAALAAVFSAAVASAQPIEETNLRNIQLEPAGMTNLNRFSLSYRMGFNYSASFHGLGGFSGAGASGHGQRTPSGDAFNYDNGYIYADQTTSSAHPGYTWYYGYAAGTVQRPSGAPTEFDLYKSTASANASSSKDACDPQPGVELAYDRQLGHAGPVWWGLEGAFGFTHVDLHDNRTLYENVNRTTTTYQTGGGAVLNPAPFQGTVTGPGPNDANGWPLVALAPVGTSSQTIAGAATITGERELDAQIFSARFGPYVDLPLSRRWMLSFSGGLLIMDVVSQFTFNETVSINPSASLVTVPGEQHHGSITSSDVLLGAYAGGNVSFALSERVRLLAGAQFQTADNFSQTVAGKTAVLNLGQAIFANVGVSYSF